MHLTFTVFFSRQRPDPFRHPSNNGIPIIPPPSHRIFPPATSFRVPEGDHGRVRAGFVDEPDVLLREVSRGYGELAQKGDGGGV
jgi:hypothetical protein